MMRCDPQDIPLTVAAPSGVVAVCATICAANSWSAGTSPALTRRLQAIAPRITGNSFVFALAQRKMSDLARRAHQAIAQRVESWRS